ncbi:DUF378 domain-containing protein [Sporosarcina sp. HYO08]|uniref:DUF378 domain-containing protein n=1 Tax=Sporosarcina sp. HYO08 TaxID=1759557 RepID=UPI0007980D96|nr:DUF378 domain-containing protein [Sporosarcina sp. HYO08]KXH79209.1 DUF378 domain-containing protein [Sporosarcina sp. HYO08]
MNKIHKLALAITIIGALNWGVAGIFRFDVVAQMAGGSMESLARFIYLLIGISGLFSLGLLFDQWRNPEVRREPKPIPEDY